MNVRKAVTVGIATTVLSLGTVAAVAPSASAIISNNGRSCVVTGSFGDYYAQKYYDNDWQGHGPRRWTKSGANSDCRQFVFGF